MFQLNQLLPEAKSLIVTLFDDSDENILLLDKGYDIIYANTSFKILSGFKSEELSNLNFLNLVNQIDKLRIKQQLENLSDEKPNAKTDNVLLIDTNKEKQLVSLSFYLKAQINQPNFVLVKCKKVLNQYALPSTTNRNLSVLESVIENIKDAVMITEVIDQNLNEPIIEYVNSSFTHITGFTLNELKGKSVTVLQFLTTSDNHLQELFNAMQQGIAFESTLPGYNKNGDLFWVNACFSPLKNDDNLLSHWIITLRDVTEKKELEDVFRKASSLAGIGSWAYEIQSQKLFWSEMTRKIFEVPVDFIPSIESTTPFLNYFKQNSIILNQISTKIDQGKSFDFEVEILTAKKSKKWVRVIGEPEFINGMCHKISGSFQDINERKRAQLLAEKTNNEKNDIFESIADGFFAVDKKWKITFWNTKAAQEVKRSKEELMHKNLWEVFAEAVGSYTYNQYHLAMKVKKVIHFESFYRMQGQWYDVSVYPSPNGLSVYFKNITTRKLEQKLLVDTEKRYSDLFQLSPLPKWVIDLETLQFLDVNKAAIKHYGYSYKQFMKMTIVDIRPTEEREKLFEIVKQPNAKLKLLLQGLFTHQKKNGDLIRVNIQSVPFTFKGRKAKLIIANDVTEQEQYINAIQLQNQKLKEVSWINSHILRAPLTKIMGLLEVARIVDEHQERKIILDYIQTAAKELDKAIMEITQRSKTNSSTN